MTNKKTVDMKATLKDETFNFTGVEKIYRGKVRDVYYLSDDLLVMVVTDRISAFDVVLPKPVPNKGAVLNMLAAFFLDMTKDIVPNWKISTPDTNVTIGKRCTPYLVEIVVRAYLTGHAWRLYQSGKREICGIRLPEGLKENQRLQTPIITPTTKASEGHDEDISKEEILKKGIVVKEEYERIEEYALKLFERGTNYAKTRGLILVDTKYEFGKDKNGEITLIDEIHTPDSSRYFYSDSYEENFKNNRPPKQLSKEFVRKKLMELGFSVQNQNVPELKDEFINEVSDRYIELYERLTGEPFLVEFNNENAGVRIERNVNRELEKMKNPRT